MVTKPETVGILGYQGCIEPHEAILSRLGAPTLRVKTPEDLALVSKLILPGGESTTMLRFINLYGMMEALREFTQHKPTWGICAGSILLASEVVNPSQPSLGAIDVRAHRNFYGAQTESFSTQLTIELLSSPIETQFIRAPLLDALNQTPGRQPVNILARLNQQPVFLSQGKVWACSFHVELGADSRLHELFLKQQ